MRIELVHPIDHSSRETIASCETLHRQLRPKLEQPYTDQIAALLAEGARLAVGYQEGRLQCLALFRIFATTLGGKRLYVDDPVVDAESRGRTLGAQMLTWIEVWARSQGCIMATLESGVERDHAHRFYFRSGYCITAFSFEKAL